MDFALIGIPYDESQTLRRGSSKSPDVFRETFPKLETHISGINLSESFIEDLGNLTKNDLENLEINKFPVILGGDHSVTLSGVKSVKPETIVIFDAHPDLEDKDDHSGITRKLIENGYNVVLFGVRTISKSESDYMKENNIKIASLEDLKNINSKIYLSIDLDILDPSIISVGNPEPDGLTFKEIIDAIKIIAKNLIAVDFVEFIPDNETKNIIASKLVYSALAEIVKSIQ
jgi:agmatinase